ncbi:MAG: hypothetical protein FJ096_18040 [Deltaproteobacteria bacterium]|nr:hypothetical protein [Deltaproteobacteria bacterium]
MRPVPLTFLALVACNTPVRTDGPQAGASSSVAAPAEGQGAKVDGAAEPAGLAPATKGKRGPGGTILLASGASLTPPAGATEADLPSALPAEVRSAHVFTLAGDARLMVNEVSHEGQTCAAALDKEWAKMQAARGDTDPERLKFRKMRDVERLEVGGLRAIYGASSHGTGQPGEVASLATLVFCAGEDQVVAMLAARQAEVPPNAKETLFALLQSHRAK